MSPIEPNPSQGPAAVAAVLAAFAGWKATYDQAGQQKVMDALWALEAAYAPTVKESLTVAPVPAAPAAPVDARKAHAHGYTCGIADALLLAIGEGDPIAAEEGRWKEFNPGSASTGEASHG